MNLTSQQITTLKAAIAAETDPAFVADRQARNTGAMAAFYNAASTNVVWRPTTRCADILSAITWASFTPADPADGSTIYTNRALLCQLKRDNLWCMLARDSLATGTLFVRTNLSDALQNVPAGIGGVALDAGWLGSNKVKTTISRLATRGESIFASAQDGTTATPAALTVEGSVSNENIVAALA